MNLSFESYFVVMPKDCNGYVVPDKDKSLPAKPMIFGGAFFSQMDLAAAGAVRRLLYDSPEGCDSAVTHKFEGTFHGAAKAGDLIRLYADIIELRRKAIVINVMAYRDGSSLHEFIAESKFVFISRKNGLFWPHGLVMPPRIGTINSEETIV